MYLNIVLSKTFSCRLFQARRVLQHSCTIVLATIACIQLAVAKLHLKGLCIFYCKQSTLVSDYSCKHSPIKGIPFKAWPCSSLQLNFGASTKCWQYCVVTFSVTNYLTFTLLLARWSWERPLNRKKFRSAILCKFQSILVYKPSIARTIWHVNLHHGLWWLPPRGCHHIPGTLSSPPVSNQLSSILVSCWSALILFCFKLHLGYLHVCSCQSINS